MGAFFSQPLNVVCRDMNEIRAFLSTCRYVSDPEQFGVRDHWMSPEEFELARKGDCEDFALWTWRQLLALATALASLLARREDTVTDTHGLACVLGTRFSLWNLSWRGTGRFLVSKRLGIDPLFLLRLLGLTSGFSSTRSPPLSRPSALWHHLSLNGSYFDFACGFGPYRVCSFGRISR